MLGSATITIETPPTAFNVTGGGAYCSDDVMSQVIGLDGSQTDVDYALILDGGATVQTLSGTGATLSFTAQTTAGTYTVVATSTTGELCDTDMLGNATITIETPPIAFNVTGGGAYCADDVMSQVIGLDGSQTGVDYALILDGGATVQTVSGTGAALSFTAQTTAGNYTVVATSTAGELCDTDMLGSATITIETPPTAFTVTGGGAYCSDDVMSQVIGLDGSQTGVDYALILDGGATVQTVSGTGAALSFTAQTTAGNYTVVATSTTGELCDTDMNGSATITIETPPTAFNVTGGGAYCSDDVMSQVIGLDGSQTGVDYALILDGGATVQSVSGTGAALSFTAQTIAGSYTVVATSTTGELCDTDMLGSATITIETPPTAFNVTGGGAYCSDDVMSQVVDLDGSQTGVDYALILDGGATVQTLAGTGAALNFTAQTTAGNYTVVATSTTGELCDTDMLGSATITIETPPTAFNVTGGGAYCSDDVMSQVIGLDGSQTGVNYALIIDGGATVETIAGTGAALSFTAQTTAGTYTVFATSTTGELCDTDMLGSAAITIETPPTAFNVTGGGAYCADDVMSQVIGLDGSQTGFDYALILDGGATVQTVSGTGAALSFTTQTTAGNYTVVATSTTGELCDTDMLGSATITIETPPTAFNVTGGGAYCSDDVMSQVIGLDGSQTGVDYALILNGGATVQTVSGTGAALSFTAQTTAGNYTVVATSTTGELCDTDMLGSATITIETPPTAFNVTGGGAYCSDDVMSQVIGLDGSQTGVDYALILDGGATVQTLAGTGAALSFTAQITAGTYTVVATSTTGELCDADMLGSVAITIETPPTAFIVTGGGAYCAEDVMSQTIGLDDSETGVNYTLILDGATTIETIPGTGDALTFTPQITVGTYTVLASNDGGENCEAQMSGSAVISVVNPSIGIVKEGIFQDENNDGFAQVGETIFYTFTVTNTGDVDLANVIVTDPLVTVDGDPILALNVGQIDAITFTASYAVQQEDLDNELFANQAFVTSDFPLCGPITDLSDDNSPFENDSTVVILIPEPVVKLLARVRLQGALLGNLTGLMRDDLRAQGFLPATEPYTAILGFDHVANLVDETIIDPATIFADNGDNSIVDWVFIELRSTMDPTLVVTTRSGFVQRDGDIVDLDGISPLCFRQVVEGSYYVAVRHRNHLGTMTGMAITMTEAGTTVDFTDPNIDLWENASAFDGIEQILVNGQYALWAGNTNANQSVVFAGQNNDETPIFNEVNGATGNIFRSQTFVLPGYLFGDVNMDSNSIFAGQNNDVNPIFDNVNGHPVNIFTSQTFVIPEQLAD
jgi:hypothetical protein